MDNKKDTHGKVKIIAKHFENIAENTKVNMPTRTVKIVNGKHIILYDESDNKNNKSDSDIDSDVDNKTEIPNKCNNYNSETESENEVQTNKSNLITKECTNFIDLVARSLLYIHEFRNELKITFESNEEVYNRLMFVFKEVDTLRQLYNLINEKRVKLAGENNSVLLLPSLFLDREVSALLKMYKPFLTSYADNAKWLGELQRSDHGAIFESAINRTKESQKMDSMISLDTCLYTVFNSLFSYELFLTRYWKSYEPSHSEYQRANEAKNVLTKLLGEVNTSQDKESFLNTQKELSLLTARSREAKINTRFIFKEEVKKISRRDGKILNRQLVLFTDCLFVTLQPNALTGQSAVRQEMSLDGMQVTELNTDSEFNVMQMDHNNNTNKKPDSDQIHTTDESIDDLTSKSNVLFLLNIRSREADQDFLFTEVDSRSMWKNKLVYYSNQLLQDLAGVLTKRVNLNNNNSVSRPHNNSNDNRRSVGCQDNAVLLLDNANDSPITWLGKVAPRWQKDGQANYCNGYKCYKEFGSTQRRHHCRADGLLYCESCCNWKMHLPFERHEARVCELCYNILQKYPHSETQRKEFETKLETVFIRKTRSGRMMGWVSLTELNRNNRSQSKTSLHYYCVLDDKTPFMDLFTKMENKIKQLGIMLTGMKICDKPLGRCKNHAALKENQFSLEHDDIFQVYVFKVKTPQICEEWKNAIRDSVFEHLQ